MTILDRVPIPEKGWAIATPDGVAQVHPYQMIVTISITSMDVGECSPDAPVIPAILDTGNNHNLAIRREHWDRWVRWEPRRIGQIHVGGFIVPLFEAKVWIHSNREMTDGQNEGLPRSLEMDQGIAIYPASSSNPARLPILGLRGLIRNNLRLTIDGQGRSLSLESPSV